MNHATAVEGDRLFTYGGYDFCANVVTKCQMMDLTSQSWVNLPVDDKLRANRAFHTMTACGVFSGQPGSGLYIFGGHNANSKPTNTLYCMSIKSLDPLKYSFDIVE